MKQNIQRGAELFDLSSSQKMLFLSQIFCLEKKSANEISTITCFFYVKENADKEAIKKAFNRVIELNDSMRLRIVEKNILHHVQYITDYPAGGYEIGELGKKFTNEKEMREFAEKHLCDYEVKVSTFPMWWAKLADVGESGAVLFMRLSHYTSDGYSLSIIFKQLEKFYDCYKEGKIPEAPKTLFSVKEYFKLEKEYATSEQRREDAKFWKGQYGSQKHYSYPAGRTALDGTAAIKRMTVSGERYNNLIKICSEAQCSVHSFMMTVAALTTYYLTRKRNFCISSFSHERNNYYLRQTVGCMMNNVPLFYNMDREMNVREFISKNYLEYLDNLSHGKFPQNSHLKYSNPLAMKHGMNFNHLWIIVSTMEFGDVIEHSEYIPGVISFKKIFYQMYLSVLETKGSHIDLSLNYQVKCFNDKKMEKIIKAFTYVLNKILDNPDLKVGDLKKTK